MSTNPITTLPLESITIHDQKLIVDHSQAISAKEAAALPAVFQPTAQWNDQQLDRYYQPRYYATLSAAVADVNAGTVGTIAAQEQTPVAAVYQDENEKTVILLLGDITLTENVNITATCDLKLNGHVITYAGDYAIYFQAATGACVIDGRVPGSLLTKSGTSSANVPMLRFAGESATLQGVRLTADLTSSAGNQNIIVSGLNRDPADETLATDPETALVMDGCTLQVQVQTQPAGKNLTAVMSHGPMTLRNCDLQLSNQQLTIGVWPVDTTGTLVMENTAVHVLSQEKNAVALWAAAELEQAIIRGCQLSAATQGSSLDSTMFYAVAADLLCRNTAIEGSQLEAYAADGQAFGIWLENGAAVATASIRSSRVHTAAAGSDSQSTGIICGINAVSLEEVEVFADSSHAGEAGIGISSAGRLTLKQCRIYGARQGMDLYLGCEATVDGGVYEGSTHGGMAVGNYQGTAYAQNAVFRAAKYRGQFKSSSANYAQGYMMAAVYIGGEEDCSNISVYMDNCLIDGGSPVIYYDSDTTPVGCEPVRFRGSSGEQNNTLYLSNCTLQGAGKLFFANDTHRLYLGLGNTLGVQTNLPERIDTVTYSGKVFIAPGQTN